MTREEKIICRMFLEDECKDKRYDEYKRLLMDLIDAQPCEEDLSREHLLSEIDKLMQSPWFNNGKDDDGFTHYGYVERKEAVEIVRDLCVKTEPTVTPKQRTGHWEVYKQHQDEYLICDQCRKLYSRWMIAENYCPNCGAKMEGVSE